MITTDSSSNRPRVQSPQMNAWVKNEWISIKSKLLCFLGLLSHHLPFTLFLVFQFLFFATPKIQVWHFFPAPFHIHRHLPSFLSGGPYAHTQEETPTHGSPIVTSHLFSVSFYFFVFCL